MQTNHKEHPGNQLQVGMIVEIGIGWKPVNFAFFFLLKKQDTNVFLILDEHGQVKERIFRTNFLYSVINDQ
jgi:hypothetical protein